MAASTKDLVNSFVKLDQKIKKKEGEVDTMKEERAALETQLLQRFQDGGIASMKTALKVNVYIRRDLWAGAANKENKAELFLALKDLPETRDLVQETVNSQTLSSFVREKARECFGDNLETTKPEDIVKALPEALQSVISVTEKFSLRTSKSR
jgi:hypothetical protein